MIAWCSLILIMPLIGSILITWRQYLSQVPETAASSASLRGIVLPLLASAGFLGLLWDRDGVLGAPGGLVLGSGPLIFGIVVGLLLVIRPGACAGSPSPGRVLMPVSGIVLIMIAAAGRVPHTVGLMACTIGLVLIWLNSLRSRSDHVQMDNDQASQQPLSLTLALAGSLMLAFCTLMSPIEWMPLVVLALIVEVLLMLFLLMRSRGVPAAFEAVGWFAILLPCLGLGLLGQDRLAVFIGGNDLPGLRAAFPTLRSTEPLLIPGVTILIGTVFWSLAPSLAISWKRSLGITLLLIGFLGFFELTTEFTG